MKLSVIFIYDGLTEQADISIESVRGSSWLGNNIELIFADPTGQGEGYYNEHEEEFQSAQYISMPDELALMKKAFTLAEGEFFTVVRSGDRFDPDYYERVINIMEEQGCSVGMCEKYFSYESFNGVDQLSAGKKSLPPVIDLTKRFGKFPWFMEGTVLQTNVLAAVNFDVTLGVDAEKLFLLRVSLLNNMVSYATGCQYVYCTPHDNEYRLFQGVYDKDWYFGSVRRFTEFSRELNKNLGIMPRFVQYFFLYMLYARIDANINNRNKHVLDENEAYQFEREVSTLLKEFEDEVILNIDGTGLANRSVEMRLLMIRIKNDFDKSFEQMIKGTGTLYMAYKNMVLYKSNQIKVNVLFMNYVNGMLEIDATINSIFPKSKCTLVAILDDHEILPIYNERYTLTKIFGCSAYKRHSMHFSVPIDELSDKYRLRFALKAGNKYYNVYPEYKSHTSRISGRLVWMYWPMTSEYVLYHKSGGMIIERMGKGGRLYRQLRMFKQLISGKSKLNKRALKARAAYWLTKPFFRNKKIWMFYDKIYKGGDSSEYLYRYASKMDDGITKYYLIDKNAADYERIKADGFKPLVRGSLKHRLVFFNAQMMIVSNSTVFAFNDLTLQGSSFFRDIVDFHVVCVQHGLSVQKIAIAQNRLRDNTRLYFCASPVEIENLSRPVYDYVGYDALKLTGVPRYDGLVNNDKKQIMISPTWRMQSAMLVSKNEGVARDYNEHFKETPYYKVFNSLINDERLLNAAKRYGYKIAFVLHPIVSPQASDFDQNDYVDIIPAIGDMSYEKLFCESSLMVTDFSGIQFDFAYMRKPLVYLHHNDIPQHYEEGAYHYDTMAFGEIVHTNDELIDKLTEYMSTGCKMKDEYRARADRFFAFDDHDNCKRIYSEMIKYQVNVIDANKK